MSKKEIQDTSLSFPEEKEESQYSVFLLEDLLREYNSKMLSGPPVMMSKNPPLRLNASGYEPSFIRPLTQEESKAMRLREKRNDDWMLIKEVLSEQVSPKGLIGNIPNIAAGVTIAELVNELGLKGEVYYKKVGDKVYVILKGLPSERSALKGTRYLNTHPEIVRFGLAKVDVKTAFKAGFKTSIWIYGAIKSVEALEMLWEDGELKPKFFSDVVADVPKLAITSVVAAVAVGAVAAVGVPVAVGAGIVLAVGVATGIALDVLDRKIGFSQKLSEAADALWKNLKEKASAASKDQKISALDWDPLQGLIFGGPLLRNQRVIQKWGNFVYIV